MIERLRIRNVGVIADAELELGPGFVAVTGETGAGKTMVLTGIAMLMGVKLDSNVIRAGADAATVEGEFAAASDDVIARIVDAGGSVDEDVALLTRTLSRAGRGRAVVGGRTAPIAVLTELAERLVAVHGQRDQARLLREGQQREALDEFGRAHGLRDAYVAAYEQWRECSSLLAKLESSSANDKHELALLQAGVAELDELAATADEDELLAVQLDRMGNAAELSEYVHRALALLRDERAAADSILTAQQSLSRASQYDVSLAPLVSRSEEVAVLVDQLAVELDAYVDGLDSDPAALDAMESRRAALNAAKRKFGPTLSDVFAWYERAQLRILAIDTSPERIAELRTQCDAALAALALAGRALSEARERAAAAFGVAVTDELNGLAMPNARVVVRLTELAEPAPHGLDRVELLMTTHDGDEPRPLGKGASGGELSRIMLAVEVVLGAHNPVPTFVFDEVDAGVGGKAAVEIGKRLADLARHAQVIVVTHLPQVAAFADTHVVVTKASDGQVFEANVQPVTGEARLMELARMMAGQEGSATGEAHAAELLETADALKREMSGGA